MLPQYRESDFYCEKGLGKREKDTSTKGWVAMPPWHRQLVMV